MSCFHVEHGEFLCGLNLCMFKDNLSVLFDFYHLNAEGTD